MDDLIPSVPDDQQRRDIRQRVDDGERKGVPARLGHRFFQKFAVDVLELLLVHPLHREAADNGNALDPFMQITLDRRERLGTVLGQQLKPLVKCIHRNPVQRQNRNRHQGQHRIQIKHKGQGEHQCEHIQPDVHHPDFHEIFALFDVIDKSGDRFTDLGILIIAEREPLQMSIQPVPHVKQHSAGNQLGKILAVILHRPPDNHEQHKGAPEHRHQLRHPRRYRERRIVQQVIDHIFQNQRQSQRNAELDHANEQSKHNPFHIRPYKSIIRFPLLHRM
ncbi:hypothetical protein D3C75_603240 [compost metagenome]